VQEVYEVVARVQDLFAGPDACRVVSRLYELTGDVDKAIAWGIRARNLEPDNRDHVEWLAELYAEIDEFDTVLELTPEPSVGLLYLMRRYAEAIDAGELLMIDEPEDIELRYLLAFAYNATGNFESAIWVLSSTGQPGIVMETPRMGADWEGFYTLVNAVDGAGDRDLAQSLAAWYVNEPQHHDNADWFVEVNTACMLSVLGRDGEALEKLELARRSPRLPPRSVMQDTPCFQRFQGDERYRAVVDHFDTRRAELRARLPRTLAEFGVRL